MLVTNGCSFVWGDELEGYDNSPPTHWDQTFAYKLAEKLGEPLTNLATCGGGNMKIFRDTLNYIHHNKPPKYLVIIWSAFQRWEHAEAIPPEIEETLGIQRWNSLTQISPERVHHVRKDVRKMTEDYLSKAQDPRLGITYTLTYMRHIQFLCDTLGIKVIQGVFHDKMYGTLLHYLRPEHRERNWGPWMDLTVEYLEELRDECKLGLGPYIDMHKLANTKYKVHQYGHPCKDTHTEYANLLYHIFQTQCGVEIE
jgi:hypothetical protein